MPVQIAGFTAANIMEIEAATRAGRVTIKPADYGSLGIYSLAQASGVMTAGLAAAAPVFSWRWGDATRFAVLKKLIISAGNTSIAFTAGAIIFNAFIARSFTASDTGGTDITPTGSGNKLRTSMGTTLLTSARISSTGTLTAGTRTLDANPFGSLTSSIPAVGGTPLIGPTPLFQAQAGDYPVVFAQNEGFVIQATVPATGTWTFSVQAQWEEFTAYVP